MTTLKLIRLRSEPVCTNEKNARAQKAFAKELALYTQQQRDLLWLSLYFNKVWQRCKAKAANELTHIRLTRLRQSIARENRDLVLAVANIWFVQAFRGNNITGKCSSWSHKSAPNLNKRMRVLIKELMNENADAVQETWSVMSQPDETSIELKTVVKFKTKEQAELFRTLFGAEIAQ